jgi:hypothetical protein
LGNGFWMILRYKLIETATNKIFLSEILPPMSRQFVSNRAFIALGADDATSRILASVL